MCAIFVHKSLNVLDRHENDAREVLTRFSMQLLHRKIKFTALGLFPLDNTLIFTVNDLNFTNIAGTSVSIIYTTISFSNRWLELQRRTSS